MKLVETATNLKNDEWISCEHPINILMNQIDDFEKSIEQLGYKHYIQIADDVDIPSRVFLTVWKLEREDSDLPGFYAELELVDIEVEAFYLQDIHSLLKFMAHVKPALDLVMAQYELENK